MLRAASFPDSVRIEAMHVSSYRLPLKQRWVTGQGSVSKREGFLVRLATEEGAVGYGDCAPLVEAGTETLAQAETRLRDMANASSGRALSGLLETVAAWTDKPAARNAVETAVLDVYSQARDLPLSRYLSETAASALHVNANAGALDSGVLQRCLNAVDAGYSVIKVKAGTGSINNEISIIKTIVYKSHENLGLRVDANQSWSEQDARQVVKALRDLPIECLEEPLKDPSKESLRRLQDMTSWPIAIDESVPLWSRRKLVSDPPTRRVICKPAVLGGLRNSLELAKALEASGTEVVITTTLESAAGTWACAHLAAALNNNRVHGLATSDWFSVDTGVPPQVRAGSIDMPSTPGLGFTPHGAG